MFRARASVQRLHQVLWEAAALSHFADNIEQHRCQYPGVLEHGQPASHLRR